MSNKEKPLSQKRKTFALEYLVDLCAKNAAIRAGYSPHTAKEIGYNILKDPRVQTIIHTELDKRKRRLDVTADRVLEELAAVAFGNVTDIVDWEGGDLKMKNREDIPAHILACISEINVREGGQLHLKMHSKLKGLDLLGKYLDLWAGTKNFEINIVEGTALQDQLLQKLQRVIDVQGRTIDDTKQLEPAKNGD